MKYEDFKPSRLPRGLHAAIPQVYYLESVSSTQDAAKELADAGAQSGTLVIAGTQSKGRGREDRSWASPQGGLYFSLLFRPINTPEHMPDVPYLAAQESAKLLSELYGIKTKVKKPNDVLCFNPKDGTYKKIAGFLTETSISNNKIDYVVLGVGININSVVPKELKNSATSVFEITGKKYDPGKFIKAILDRFCFAYFLWTASSTIHQQ